MLSSYERQISSRECHVGFPDTAFVAPTTFPLRIGSEIKTWLERQKVITRPLDFGSSPLECRMLERSPASLWSSTSTVLMYTRPNQNFGNELLPRRACARNWTVWFDFFCVNYDSYSALGVAKAALRCSEAGQRASITRSTLKSSVGLSYYNGPHIAFTPNWDIYLPRKLQFFEESTGFRLQKPWLDDSQASEIDCSVVFY